MIMNVHLLPPPYSPIVTLSSCKHPSMNKVMLAENEPTVLHTLSISSPVTPSLSCFLFHKTITVEKYGDASLEP